jgi:hypothetical protein
MCVDPFQPHVQLQRSKLPARSTENEVWYQLDAEELPAHVRADTAPTAREVCSLVMSGMHFEGSFTHALALVL